MKDLTLANIDTVCWIARLGSFTAAAARLNTTQPAVSARVRELESKLGVKLFERNGRQVELSVEGREFVRQVGPLLQQLESVSIQIGAAQPVGMVQIGVTMTSMSWFPMLIAKLKQAMPRVTYEVEVARAAELLQLLEGRKLDLAIVSGPVESRKLSRISLGYDRMLWVMAAARIGRARKPDIAELLQRSTIWSVPRSSFYSTGAIRQVLSHGAKREQINVISNMAAAVEMVKRGGGIGLLSESMVREELAAGTLVALPKPMDCGEPVEFSVVRHRDDTHRIVSVIMEAAVAASTFRRRAASRKDNAR